MSLATIRTAVWQYLNVASPTLQEDALLLSAMNNVRQGAEHALDLEAARCVAYVTVSPTGTAMSAAKAAFSSGAPSGTDVDVKAITDVDVYDATSAVWLRGTYVSLENYEARKEQFNRRQVFDDTSNVDVELAQLDTTLLPFGTHRVVLYHGLTLYTPSTSSIQVKLRGFKWFTPYADFDAADDWLVQRCEQWFTWAVVVELNMLRHAFVQRAEGSIDLSELHRLRDASWDNVVLQNSFIHQGHLNFNG